MFDNGQNAPGNIPSSDNTLDGLKYGSYMVIRDNDKCRFLMPKFSWV